MSKVPVAAKYSLIVSALLFVVSGCATAQKTDPSHPNIIYIMVDDMGYSELGCYGNKFNETPNIDKLASEGIRFINFYAGAPVCSPSRAGLMTGQYPARVGITDYLRPASKIYMDTTQYTMAEMLRDNGYHTGIVGKWHLSGYLKNDAPAEFLPGVHGFQEVLISEKQGISMGPYWYPYQIDPTIKQKIPGKHEFLVDRMNLEAVEFIERNKEKPFFLYLSHYAIHTNVHGKPEIVDHFRKKAGAGTSPPAPVNSENDPYKNWPADFKAKSNNPHLAAQLFSVDEGVGMIMKKLKELGLDKNTLVILTGDNGGETTVTTNAPLRAGKSTLYEGGVREAFIMRQPSEYAKGRIESARLVNYDIYPTFMDLIHAKPNQQKVDGVTFAPLLKNTSYKIPERSLYWHYPLAKSHFLGGRSAGSIIKGDWKLIEFFDTNEKELFNLKEDVSEKNDLAGEKPEKVKQMVAELSQWRTDIGAKTTVKEE